MSPVNEAAATIDENQQDVLVRDLPGAHEKGRLRERLLNLGRAAVIAAEVTPANEALRFTAFGAAQAISGDPAIGALAYGGSTLAIEGSAGMATASALNTESGKKGIEKLNSLLEKIGLPPNVKTSKSTKAATALMVGTAANVALKHREEPGRSREENRNYGLKNAASLAGVCAVQGYLMSKGISAPSLETIGAGIAALGGTQFGAKKVLDHVKRRREMREAQQLQDYLPDSNIRVGLTFSSSEKKKAAQLEQEIWDKNGFGSLEEYEKYNKHSRVFTAFDGDECLGITRLFPGKPEAPPFTALPIADEKDRQMIEEECKKGAMEELGTTAVDHEKSDAPKHAIALDMWRLAYRDARSRGIKYWGIIMEPERVEKMNEQFNFTFKQLGPTEDYQGGDCAAFLMNLEEVDKQMSESMPELYDWFVVQPLNSDLQKV